LTGGGAYRLTKEVADATSLAHQATTSDHRGRRHGRAGHRRCPVITPAALAERIRQHGRAGGGGPTHGAAQCPAPDDQSPSLSIGTGTDGIPLVHCQAGCPTESVLDAVGLTMADLMPDRDRPEQPRVVATYPYHDEHGQLLYEVRRIEP